MKKQKFRSENISFCVTVVSINGNLLAIKQKFCVLVVVESWTIQLCPHQHKYKKQPVGEIYC